MGMVQHVAAFVVSCSKCLLFSYVSLLFAINCVRLNTSRANSALLVQSSSSYSISLCNQTMGLYTFTSNPVEHFRRIGIWRHGQGWATPLPGQLFPNMFTDFGNRLLIIGTISVGHCFWRSEGSTEWCDFFHVHSNNSSVETLELVRGSSIYLKLSLSLSQP